MTTAKDIINQMHQPTDVNRRLIEKAYNYTIKAHKGQKRKSGEDYATHLIWTGFYLAEMGMGANTIVAGLLHDTIEDTEVTSDNIRNEFGEEILFLVEGVTKLSSVRYYGTDRHNESLRKLFVATSQDIRVLIVKLVDRLHNMQTLEFVSKGKRLRIATETLEIYVSVAHRLGMGLIRKQLEDYAFAYVYPKEYKKVCTILNRRVENSRKILEKERRILQKKLADAGLVKFNTSYRVKGLYSLYHKLQRKDWDIDNVYDLMAIRIVVNNVEDCYRAMGIVHSVWQPMPKRIKDYINLPKPNGYKSIHTTVFTQNGTILEIQIRTREMHNEAEYGVAAHMIYKNTTNTQNSSSWFANLVPSLFKPFSWRDNQQSANISSKKDIPPQQKIPNWIHQIGEMYSQDEVTGKEFIDDMRTDFFSNRIFVFTPKGDVIDLPVGATPIDFAYAIHSEIGNHIAGVKVNKKMVQLDTILRNGNIVEIETKKNAKPSQKWLQIARTSVAKRRIKITLEENKK